MLEKVGRRKTNHSHVFEEMYQSAATLPALQKKKNHFDLMHVRHVAQAQDWDVSHGQWPVRGVSEMLPDRGKNRRNTV